MKVLGIDPGYAIVGWGVISQQGAGMAVEACGAITTPSGMAFERRLAIIYDELCHLAALHKPDAIAIEQLFFTTNQKTVIFVAQARGVVLLAAVKAGVPVFEYTPLQVKQAVVGYGKAQKRQIMEMTRRMLDLEALPKPDDVADALAVAICHLSTAGSLLSAGRRITTYTPELPAGGYPAALLARNPQLRQALAEGPRTKLRDVKRNKEGGSR